MQIPIYNFSIKAFCIFKNPFFCSIEIFRTCFHRFSNWAANKSTHLTQQSKQLISTLKSKKSFSLDFRIQIFVL